MNKKSDETYAKQLKSWEQRKAEGKSVGAPPAQYSAATGTDGYFWEEAEVIKTLHKEDAIDKNYFRKLCDDAIAAIEEYGNFNDFVEGVCPAEELQQPFFNPSPNYINGNYADGEVWSPQTA